MRMLLRLLMFLLPILILLVIHPAWHFSHVVSV